MSQAPYSEAVSPLLCIHVAVFPIPSQKAALLLPTASQLVGDWRRREFGMGHQFLELVSVTVFDGWRFNI